MSKKEMVEKLEEFLRLAKEDKVKCIFVTAVIDGGIINYRRHKNDTEMRASQALAFYLTIRDNAKRLEEFFKEQGLEISEEKAEEMTKMMLDSREKVNTIESIFKKSH